MIRAPAQGMPVCLTVTHHDGLVLTRSALHHSVNYRYVMAYGQTRAVTDPTARMRSSVLRPPTKLEMMKAINIVEMEIEGAVAKSGARRKR
jgi:uncharacterized protein